MLTDPSSYIITLEQFVEADDSGVDSSFSKEVFGEARELSKRELLARLDSYYDYFISYDWGRDFGIDNQRRVKDLTGFLSSKKDYSFCDTADKIRQCRMACVCLTDRYYRRYLEQSYIKREFSLIQEIFGPGRQVFFEMEARASRKATVLLADFPHVADVPTISVTDHDNLFEVVAYRVLHALSSFSSLREIKDNINFMSKRAIFDAVQTGNPPLLHEALSKQYCFPDQDKDPHGMALLHLAVTKKQTECVKMLLDFGVDVNLLWEKEQRTALHFACQSDNEDVFLMLVQHPKINVNCVDKSGNTPALFAAQKHLLQVLATHKADFSCPNKDGGTPLDYLSAAQIKEHLDSILGGQRELIKAAQLNDFDALKQLINQKLQQASWQPSDLDVSNEDGRSPLYFACMHRNIEMVEYLLGLGANVNHRDNWQETVLSDVCYFCNDAALYDLALVKILIQAGSDVYNVNSWGNTPFFNACQHSNATEVSLYLLQHSKPKLNDTGRYFKEDRVLSILEVVIREKSAVLLTALLNAGACVDSTSTLQEIIALGVITDLHLSAFLANENRLWFQLLQFEDLSSREAEEKVCRIISDVVQKYPKLFTAKDHNGRIANVVATDLNRDMLNSLFLWHGRYRPTQSKPEHCSATTIVFRAIDESSPDENGNYQPVAIKLMRFKQHFEKELFARKCYKLDDDYIVNVVASYPKEEQLPQWPADIGETLLSEAQEQSLTKDQVEKMYCVAMRLADRNMFVSLKQERFAGRNFEAVKEIFRQLLLCADHLHKR
eukprot:gene37879-46013_t